MTTSGRSRQKKVRHDDETVASLASLENHVRIQESQEEFLKWLETSEKKNPELDRFFYKKIR